MPASAGHIMTIADLLPRLPVIASALATAAASAADCPARSIRIVDPFAPDGLDKLLAAEQKRWAKVVAGARIPKE